MNDYKLIHLRHWVAAWACLIIASTSDAGIMKVIFGVLTLIEIWVCYQLDKLDDKKSNG